MKLLVVSNKPPYLQSISRLSLDFQSVVLTLLDHPALKRLGAIKELGLTSKVFTSATHTRWDHTLWTVDRLCHLLEATTSLPREIKIHLLAFAIVQDIGHAPFSNALAPVFGQDSPHDPLIKSLPFDKAWTVRIMQNLEQRERLFSRIGLNFEAMMQLAVGRFPWPEHAWAHRLVEGALDADRLAYVEQDTSLTLGLSLGPSIARIAKSLIPDGPLGSTIIDSAGIQDVYDFIRVRGSIYTGVYHHLRKLAWELLMKSVLHYIWNTAPDKADFDRRKPMTVEEFLKWDDDRVERIVKKASRTDEILNEVSSLLKRGELMVAEIEELGTQSLSFSNVDKKLEEIDFNCFPTSAMWIFKSSELEAVTIHQRSSILVKETDSYKPLESSAPELFSLGRKLNRAPMIIAGYGNLPGLVEKLVSRGLTLRQLQALTSGQRRGP